MCNRFLFFTLSLSLSLSWGDPVRLTERSHAPTHLPHTYTSARARALTHTHTHTHTLKLSLLDAEQQQWLLETNARNMFCYSMYTIIFLFLGWDVPEASSASEQIAEKLAESIVPTLATDRQSAKLGSAPIQNRETAGLGNISFSIAQGYFPLACNFCVHRVTCSNSPWGDPSNNSFVVEVLLYVHRNRRFIRVGSPGRPPRLSHSSWALKSDSANHLVSNRQHSSSWILVSNKQSSSL